MQNLSVVSIGTDGTAPTWFDPTVARERLCESIGQCASPGGGAAQPYCCGVAGSSGRRQAMRRSFHLSRRSDLYCAPGRENHRSMRIGVVHAHSWQDIGMGMAVV